MPRTFSGARLLELRQNHNLSQRDLAGLAGVSVMTISELESGKRSRAYFSTIRRLADALDAQPKEFYDWTQ